MDEPSEGLSPRLVLQVQEIMRRLRARGHAILLVEQNLELAHVGGRRGLRAVVRALRVPGHAGGAGEGDAGARSASRRIGNKADVDARGSTTGLLQRAAQAAMRIMQESECRRITRSTPTPATVHWGYLDAKIPPRLTDRFRRHGHDRNRFRRPGRCRRHLDHAAAPSRDLRAAQALARPAYPHRTDRRARRRAGRHAGSAHQGDRAHRRLGLEPDPPAARHAARGLSRVPLPHHSHRPPGDDREAAVGTRPFRCARSSASWPWRRRPNTGCARRSSRASSAATWTTRNFSSARRSIFRCSCRARTSRPATGMPCRATARSA